MDGRYERFGGTRDESATTTRGMTLLFLASQQTLSKVFSVHTFNTLAIRHRADSCITFNCVAAATIEPPLVSYTVMMTLPFPTFVMGQQDIFADNLNERLASGLVYSEVVVSNHFSRAWGRPFRAGPFLPSLRVPGFSSSTGRKLPKFLGAVADLFERKICCCWRGDF
jgi:hypothetical protein